MKTWSLTLEKENGKDSMKYFLKIECPDSLNEATRNLVTYFTGKPKVIKSKISTSEKVLIRETERLWNQ